MRTDLREIAGRRVAHTNRPEHQHKPHRLRGPWRRLGIAALTILLAIPGIWAVLALWLSGRPMWLGAIFAMALVVGSSALARLVRPWRYAIGAYLAVVTAVALWYAWLTPSNDRDWMADVAVLPRATIDGDLATIRNIRSFEYRTNDDFDIRYFDRTYDLSQLVSLDMIMSYWGPRNISHTILSFGFADGDYLSASIEIRREKGEKYSAVRGLFKAYELIYIFADERDVVRLRTNMRSEDTYLYRLRVPPERIRGILEEYLQRAESLARRPEFYNALTNSCALSIVSTPVHHNSQPLFHTRSLLNGHWDEDAYASGAIDRVLPFEQLREASRISEHGRAADADPDYSARVREGLPTVSRAGGQR